MLILANKEVCKRKHSPQEKVNFVGSKTPFLILKALPWKDRVWSQILAAVSWQSSVCPGGSEMTYTAKAVGCHLWLGCIPFFPSSQKEMFKPKLVIAWASYFCLSCLSAGTLVSWYLIPRQTSVKRTLTSLTLTTRYCIWRYLMRQTQGLASPKQQREYLCPSWCTAQSESLQRGGLHPLCILVKI